MRSSFALWMSATPICKQQHHTVTNMKLCHQNQDTIEPLFQEKTLPTKHRVKLVWKEEWPLVVDSFPNKYEGKGVRQNSWSEKRDCPWLWIHSQTNMKEMVSEKQGWTKAQLKNKEERAMTQMTGSSLQGAWNKLSKPHLELMKTHNHLVMKHYVCHHIKKDWVNDDQESKSVHANTHLFDKSLETVNLIAVLLQHGCLWQNLIHMRLVLDGLRSGSKLKHRKSF